MTETSSTVLVISPCLGNAVFGCGASLAGVKDALVCTLFADASSEDAFTEDDAALALLNAAPLRMHFAHTPARATLAEALRNLIGDYRPEVLMIPLGLRESNHVLAHQASCDAWLAHPSLVCFAYEESFHRRVRGMVQQRLIDLHARGIDATPLCTSAAQPFDAERRQALKREAVSAYATRLKALGPDTYDDVFHAERFWKLELASQRA
jgi:LmbE family N-acetylglucosaminyl deacetylase